MRGSGTSWGGPPRSGGGHMETPLVAQYPPLEGEGRSGAPGWGDAAVRSGGRVRRALAEMRCRKMGRVRRQVTPTRRFAATSPLEGEVGGDARLRHFVGRASQKRRRSHGDPPLVARYPPLEGP
jgi:hypothetical protein